MHHRLASAFVVGVFGTVLATAQPAASIPLTSPIPLDTTIHAGRLPNGLRYFLRVNHKPEHRAELRLFVNAGSVLEDDDQRGLAHVVEHMAFNGTEHFAKQQLVDYLESVGVRFGPDLNASTGFDETIYMLQVPTDSPAVLSKGLDILEDWAHRVSFDSTEIDKERGVVIEEWRLGRGADARLRDRQFPVLFQGSRYADRLPIGLKATIETFPHAVLKRFYHDWYRPDLMAVAAVGDFDPAAMEALIRHHFSAIPPRTEVRPRVEFPVPGHPGTRYAIATDPEASMTVARVYYPQPQESDTLVADYRRSIVERLFSQMFNQRLEELQRKPDPPFLYGYGGKGSLVRTRSAFVLGTAVREGGIGRGLSTLMTEAARVGRFGFTATELERARKDALREMESAFLEKDKTESGPLADELGRLFLEKEPSPGIGYEYQLYQRFLPGITLEEVNVLAGRWMSGGERVVLVEAPASAAGTLPTRDSLAAILDGVDHAVVSAYVDVTSGEALLPVPPTPGRITKRVRHAAVGSTELALSNGVRVILKPTTFKNDEVLFTAFRPGGSSLVPDSDYVAALTACALLQESGLGTFDRTTLEKSLAGKLVNVAPFISELSEGMGGGATPADLPTMFQMIHLFFTTPRADTSAFASYMQRMKGALENRSARPDAAFDDTLQVTLGRHHIRRRPFTVPMLGELNLQKSLALYKKRFASANGFTFVFVGNFRTAAVESLITTYIASLPSKGKPDSWRDLGIRPPEGIVAKTVRRGLEPKSRVRLMFFAPFTWNQKERFALNALAEVMAIDLREALREEKGGTYGVSVSAVPVRIPVPRLQIAVSFGCAPERLEELVGGVFKEIDTLKTVGPSAATVAKVRETELREREVNLQQNGFWLSALQFCYDNDMDPAQILKYGGLIRHLTPTLVRDAARRFIDTTHFTRVVLVPEEQQP